MIEEEIKLRCIEMAYNLRIAAENYNSHESILKDGHKIFQLVYPYLKEGKLPEDST